jgi:hypothetical protein
MVVCKTCIAAMYMVPVHGDNLVAREMTYCRPWKLPSCRTSEPQIGNVEGEEVPMYSVIFICRPRLVASSIGCILGATASGALHGFLRWDLSRRLLLVSCVAHLKNFVLQSNTRKSMHKGPLNVGQPPNNINCDSRGDRRTSICDDQNSGHIVVLCRYDCLKL